MANDLSLELERETWKVDFAMSIGSPSGHRVPIIFIESENDPATATHEVRTLCCQAAPLRLLITVDEWDETPGVWRKRGHRQERLRTWQEIVRSHGKIWPQANILGIIVGEWRPDNTLRFYAYALGEDGQLLRDENEVLVEKK